MMTRPGQYFGKYVVIRLISRGGLADVYLVKHVYLGTYAAMKVPKVRADSIAWQNFKREARITASLDHPHIIRILDFGIAKYDTPYFVMNYAANGSLRRQHPQGARLSLDQMLKYLLPTAEALDYIHERGLVHQDIKPDNLLLSNNNELWLSDFGIAEIVRKKKQQFLNVIGTPAYMAPERFTLQVSPASDQYALGVMVYEWLTGERPFQGSPQQLTWQHIYTTPPSLRAKFPEISLQVERVVLRSLEKDPARRFSSAQSFIMALSWARDLSIPPVRRRS